MDKNPIQLAPDIQPDRRRSWLPPIVSMVVLILLISPLIMEAASLCYAQWGEVLGTSVAVRTPILDSISERLEAVRENFRERVSSSFDQVPWDPKVVLPLLVVVMAIAMMMLRR